MPESPELTSPRLRALRDALAAGKPKAMNHFWDEIAAWTAPLVEPDPDDPTVSLVTFLWREREPTSHVALIEWFSPGEVSTKLMTRLPGTDCWYRSYRLRSDLRTEYRFGPNDSLLPRAEETDWDTRMRSWRRDPLNAAVIFDPDTFDSPLDDTSAWSILSLPDAAPQPWNAPRPGVASGRIERARVRSEVLDNERDVWLYHPANREPELLLILFDAVNCLHQMRIPTLLDNLTAARAIPPAAAIMIDNVDRSAELPCNPRFVQFLTDELLPWAAPSFGRTFGPDQTVAAGQSYGGLAAAYCALERPDMFGAAISQSGSFWWKADPRNEQRPVILGDAPDYAALPARVAAGPRPTARFYLDAGRLEHRSFSDGAPSLLASNRHFRDVLRAHGSDVVYREFAGGHDAVWWRSTMADGLLALFGTGAADAPEVASTPAQPETAAPTSAAQLQPAGD